MTNTQAEPAALIPATVPRAKRDAPICKACTDCDAQRDKAGAGGPSLDRIERLNTPQELHDYPGLVKSTDQTHIADRDGIRKRYEFDTDVRCSFPRGHWHATGLVVEMLCGIEVCMGLDCGEKSIIGFNAIKKDFRRRVQHEVDLGTLATWPILFEARINELKVPLLERRRVHDAIKVCFPELYKKLLRRSQASGAKRQIEDQDPLGLEIMTAPNKDIGRLTACLEKFNELNTAQTLSDRKSTVSLKRLTGNANRVATEYSNWIRATTPFTSDYNLKLIMSLLKYGGKVESTAQGWKLTSFNCAPCEIPKLRDI